MALVASSGTGGDPQRAVSVPGVLAGLGVVVPVLLGGPGLSRVTRGQTRRDPRAHWGTTLSVVHIYAGATATVVALVSWAQHSAVRIIAGHGNSLPLGALVGWGARLAGRHGRAGPACGAEAGRAGAAMVRVVPGRCSSTW